MHIIQRICLFFLTIAAGSLCYSQHEFTSLDEAQMFITSKLQEVSNPGKTYQHSFNFETGRTGMVTAAINSKDSKGKAQPAYSVDFFLEHIDPDKILQVSTTKELKLEIHAKRDQKLFKMLKDGKTSYTNTMSLYCSDAQIARDVKDALLYLVANSPSDKIVLYTEEDAYIWLENNMKKSYTSNKVTYDLSFSVDRSSKNKMIYNLTATDDKAQKKQMKYEFYLTDFNDASFKVMVTSGNMLSVNLLTVNNTKAITYFENGIQKSFVNKLDMAVNDAKLAEDIISVFERIKTANFDKEEIKVTKVDETTKRYWSSQDYSSSHSIGSFSSANLKNYTDKTYKLNLLYEPSLNIQYTSMNLKSDKTYLIYTNIPDLSKGIESSAGWYEVNEGSYAEKDGKLQLTTKRCYKLAYSDFGEKKPTGKEKGEVLDCKKSFGNSIYIELVLDDQSLYYNEYLRLHATCGDKKSKCVDTLMFAVSGTEVKPDEVRKKGDQQVTIIGLKRGTVTGETKLRATPSTKAAVKTYELEMGYDTETTETVQVGEMVTIIARTKSKSKVGKVEDYWYLVDIGRYSTEAWIHGQYIKLGQ